MPEFSIAYKRYVLATLTTVYTLNFVDRSLIVLLLEPIKQDLKLTDTQLGFLTGIAFGLFYATLGLPIARWADRGNRVSLTSMAMALWGITVMGSIWVGNFVQLVCARVAAGVGEAGCMPPTYSLVGDYFPQPADRTRAMAVYMLAGPLAALVSFAAGGWLNDALGWRLTFCVMGIPGLLIAILVKLTVTETRIGWSRSSTAATKMPTLAHVLNVLWRQESARHLCIAIILLWTLGLGLAPWYAAFMMRSHGMGTAQLGISFGLIFGLGGIAGIALGGYVTQRWFPSDERGQMRLSAAMIACLFPFYVFFLLLPRASWALFALVPLVIVSNFFLGPTFALMQRLVADEMRATTAAVVMLLANLIGMGVGPQIVGVLSDRLMPLLGADSLRYAMLTMCSVALWAAFHLWRVGRTVKDDLPVVRPLALDSEE
jgi:predicted MFS family arabinose efflux permease